MIDIIITSFYKDLCLDNTLYSLRENVRYPHRIWILDNKSPRTPQIKEVVFKHKDIISGAWLCDGNYITAPYWWAYKNIVPKDTKYFAMVEADVILPSGKECWITKAISVLDTEPKVGVVSVRTKPHSPDDDQNYVTWYNSWTPYKKNKDILKSDYILWHHLVVRKSIIDNWVIKEGYDYFWYDGLFRNKMKISGYDCVGLDWDAYHYANKESLYIYPEYKNFTGGHIFKNKHQITEKNLERII